MTFNYVHEKLPSASGKIARSFFNYPLLLPATRYPLQIDTPAYVMIYTYAGSAVQNYISCTLCF
jgi:hypothetical protein